MRFAIFSAWGAPWDYILVGTRENTPDNRFYALDANDGSIIDYYPNPADDGSVSMGPINGMASVDYANRRVYLGLVQPTDNTLICLDIHDGPDALRLGWGVTESFVDDVDQFEHGTWRMRRHDYDARTIAVPSSHPVRRRRSRVRSSAA